MTPAVIDTSDAALQELYRQHAPGLVQYLTRLTRGDLHRAEDIAQETVLRAWRHPEARTRDGEWNRRWLTTVARNIAIDQIRAGNARPTEVADEQIDLRPQPVDDIDRLVNGREVRAALATLPERFRTALIEGYFRERSVAEAAEILDVPPGTVKSRTFYALRALREALVERGFTDRHPGP